LRSLIQVKPASCAVIVSPAIGLVSVTNLAQRNLGAQIPQAATVSFPRKEAVMTEMTRAYSLVIPVALLVIVLLLCELAAAREWWSSCMWGT
jgi:hypothetical protein